MSDLQLPDAAALLGDPLHGAVHEGDEHVKQQDVGENDVADEEHVEDFLVLVMLDELHVAHANGELEELQRGVGDVLEGNLRTVLVLTGTEKTRLLRRVYEQTDHRWERKLQGHKFLSQNAKLEMADFSSVGKKQYLLRIQRGRRCRRKGSAGCH